MTTLCLRIAAAAYIYLYKAQSICKGTPRFLSGQQSKGALPVERRINKDDEVKKSHHLPCIIRVLFD